MPYATYRFNKIIAAETIRFIVTVAIVVYKGLKLVVYRMLTNHELEAEKQDADKRLTDIREAKEALLKIHRNLLDAIKAEGEATVVLQEAISSSNDIINGICNAIVKAEQNTQFKATIKSEHLAQLQQLLNQAIETWKNMLKNHRSEQTKMLTEHESNMRKILRRNEGVWFSDFWMKVLVIFLLVYTVTLGLVVYCVT